MLANAGHDVWLVNARGTRYSRKHTYLTPDDLEYWDFRLNIFARICYEKNNVF